jgi:lipopolysaccharide heptosyltransferase II
MVRSKRILVTNRAGIGDVILSTPVLKALKEKFPDSHLTLLAGRNVYPLLKGLPFLDEIITYERDEDSTLSIVRKIWRYDLAICLDFTYRSAVMAFLAAIPVRAGLRHKRGKFLTHAVNRDPAQEETYEPYNFANIIQQTTGIELTGDLTELAVGVATVKDKEYVDSLFKQAGIYKGEPVLAIAPFSSDKVKDWPVESLPEIITALKSYYDCHIVLLGSASQRQRVAGLGNVENWLGLTSLTEMAEVLRRTKVFFGVCSGPLHIAAAVKVPIVALYGASSSRHWAPKNRAVILEHSFPCQPCYATEMQCGRQQCMKSITTAEVMVGCKKLWEIG